MLSAAQRFSPSSLPSSPWQPLSLSLLSLLSEPLPLFAPLARLSFSLAPLLDALLRAAAATSKRATSSAMLSAGGEARAIMARPLRPLRPLRLCAALRHWAAVARAAAVSLAKHPTSQRRTAGGIQTASGGAGAVACLGP